MKCSTNIKSFYTLLKGGLWEIDSRLSQFNGIDFSEVYRLAQEQSVVGLVAAGIEHITDMQPPKDIVLSLVGETLHLEHLNSLMNYFIGVLVEKLKDADIYTLLVKGQGVAQCYERPLWRSCGDVDLFLSDTNYHKACALLSLQASRVDKEDIEWKHQAMTIDSWEVELHGRLACGFSLRVNKVLDQISYDTFHNGKIRPWINANVQIYLLCEEYDIIYVFVHFVNHFYKGGVGLRQICDWCRLLWKYRDTINRKNLEEKIIKMGLMNEWRAFAAFAVEYLGMPVDSMPYYSRDNRWKKKADRISLFIIEVGNFGHNRDTSYFAKYPYLIRKACSLVRRCKDLLNHTLIFPLDSLRFFPVIMYNGLRSAMKGD